MNGILLEVVIGLSIYCFLLRKENKRERKRTDDARNQLRAERHCYDFSELDNILLLNDIPTVSDSEDEE